MHGHFIEKCLFCGTIISQCRCMSKDKRIDYSICQQCKELETKKESHEG